MLYELLAAVARALRPAPLALLEARLAEVQLEYFDTHALNLARAVAYASIADPHKVRT